MACPPGAPKSAGSPTPGSATSSASTHTSRTPETNLRPRAPKVCSRGTCLINSTPLPSGVWWHNHKKHMRQKSRERKRLDRTYADVNKRALKDRAERVAAPVSLGSAGVPRETFDRARARIAAGMGTRRGRPRRERGPLRPGDRRIRREDARAGRVHQGDPSGGGRKGA